MMKKIVYIALLLLGGVAHAQVVVEGNVYGGCDLGEVVGNTTVTVNDGTVGEKMTLEQRTADSDEQVMHVDNGNVYGGGNGYYITGTNPDGSPIFNGNDINAGRVTGTTTVTIGALSGGKPVVRRAVYGGGNMGSVGVCTVADNGIATYTAGGTTNVTITGKALIGPKKTDLTEVGDVTTNFKYLGCNEGWVFGSSRGVAGSSGLKLAFANTTNVTIEGNAQVLNVYGGGENGHVQGSTNVIVQGNSIVGGVPLHAAGSYTVPVSGLTGNDGEYAGVTISLATEDSETAEDKYGVGRNVVRGNVFGGGNGTDFIPWLLPDRKLYSYTAGRVYGNTNVTIRGNALVYNRVYGGGAMASVGTFTEYNNPSDPDEHSIVSVNTGTGLCTVNILGGIIGSNVASPSKTNLNCGDVYGGSLGRPGRPRKPRNQVDPGDASTDLEALTKLHQVVDLAYVGSTNVTVDGATVRNSVYGGGASGHVQGDASVLIKETTPGTTYIGTLGVGTWHSNVYGGGGGTARYTEVDKHHSITAGRVFGNTNIEITGGQIYHNVYGGGSLASVGTYLKYNGVEQSYFGGGIARIDITGGTIGTDGHDNGHVFGSGRGEIAAPGGTMDTVTYMAYTFVNIGKENWSDDETPVMTGYSGNAKINGSVYGSGENGHVYLESHVNVYSGTIGCTPAEYESYGYGDLTDAAKAESFANRGNVYGAGCGTDQYDTDADGEGDTYNPNTGYVWGNTEVNIHGGYISRNVYGGGAMGSVGIIDATRTVAHPYESYHDMASLSWPYELTYSQIPDSNNNLYPAGGVKTGKAVVNIFGGHIGTVAAPDTKSGNVFGSARGAAGPLGILEQLALARETEVNINFEPPTGNIDNATPNVILGSVYGSGENGAVYENTKVTLTNGLVVGSLFGGGDGSGVYNVQLKDPDTEDPMAATPQHSITAGKVYGNTKVVMAGGTVLHNVFGGGNLASVGKGNYMGYDELSNESITPTADPYENSGICEVLITGGTVGTTGYPDAGVNNGFVFGASRGITFKTVDKSPRYDYSRDFFLGYVNKTIVKIGSDDPAVLTGPAIKGSVFGGGDNGHVRWHTDVTINKGEIGVGYTSGSLTADEWSYRGNVYGGGHGTDKYDSDGNGTPDSYCSSAGSVTLNTNVTVNGGTIHRNVYGGGSMASVGPPTGYNPGTSTCTVNLYGGTIGQTLSSGEIAALAALTPSEKATLYGGLVFGGSRGNHDIVNSSNLSILATAVNTQVNIYGASATLTGAYIFGDVYGGGEIGQTKQNTEVNIYGGTVESTVYGGGMGVSADNMAANVYGNATVNMTGGNVNRSVYGGGELGTVGSFNYADNDYVADNDRFKVGQPYECATGTGLATVSITGGQVGLRSMAFMPPPSPEYDDCGYVFAGGRGVGDNTATADRFALCNNTSLTIGGNALVTASAYGGSENGIVFNDTYVHITGTCQIGVGVHDDDTDDPYTEEQWNTVIEKVRNETFTASDASAFHNCSSWKYTAPYYVYDPEAIYVKLTEGATPVEFSATSFYANEDYRNQIANAAGFYYDAAGTHSSEGGTPVGTDGHSFYGNVFGGGSGYYPYAPGQWRRTAGAVLGNVTIDIDGGHILSSVYGGNEHTDVGTYTYDDDGNDFTYISGGTCTINMTGGTIGVPRSIDAINALPIVGNLFGGGKGDQRVLFNQWTNVGDVVINVTGGHIFGSVFGGGEDGHVINNVNLNIGDIKADDAYHDDNPEVAVGAVITSPCIGTQGLSTFDGNVFGGGRGFSGDALTAGAVCGNVEVDISGGTILGSVYGGGRLASVGTFLAPVGHENYGRMQEGEGHGFINVVISGGTIGNKRPYIFFTGDKNSDLRNATYGSVVGKNNWDYNKVENKKEHFLKSSTVNNILTHTSSGNVFGGCMGRRTSLRGTVSNIWPNLARCKQTSVTISGNARIRSSVYGGGEIGTVMGNSTVNVEGGIIGSRIVAPEGLKDVLRKYSNPDKFAEFDYTNYRIAALDSVARYHYGSVFGGGYGDENFEADDGLVISYSDELALNHAPSSLFPVHVAGRVYGNTYVNILGGQVLDNVYGGGDIASVGTTVYDATTHMPHHTLGDEENEKPTGICYVNVSNGTIGPVDYTGHNGHVFGGGRGIGDDPDEHYKLFCNVKGTELIVSGGTISGCTFGGGEDCHVLGDAHTTIEGGTIGYHGITEHDGCVFGGGRNINNKNHTAGRVQGNTRIDITGGFIKCTVFGGGSMARTGVDENGLADRFTTIVDGKYVFDSAAHGNAIINISGTYTDRYNTVIGDAIDEAAGFYLVNCDYTIGDIFGGGKGDTRDSVDNYAGRVMNTYVTVTGSPRIRGDIYAGGEMACVGWRDHSSSPKYDSKYYEKTGYTHLHVSGDPFIGSPTEFDQSNISQPTNWSIVDPSGRLFHTCSGNIYGGGQGFVCDGYQTWVNMGHVRQTYVTMAGGHILGNVFGGGSRGHVMENTYVKVTGGLIGTDITSVPADVSPLLHYYYGSVFGGGYGNPNPEPFETLSDSVINDNASSCIAAGHAGRVYGNTYVDISGGHIMDCVYGGGDLASVGYIEKDANGIEYLHDHTKWHNGKCNVYVHGNAIVGPLDYSAQNAYVYGGGRGESKDPDENYKRFSNAVSTEVIIDLTTTGTYEVESDAWDSTLHGGRIWGSLFGGGADSHVLGDVCTRLKGGLVGTRGLTSYDGNIFGGGRNYRNTNHSNGRVQGNISVVMTGGTLQGTIFGGGRLALSGVDVDGNFPSTDWVASQHGNVSIDVSGDATIGTSNSRDLLYADESVGDIFGSGKGDIAEYDDILAGRVTNSIINVRDSYTYAEGHEDDPDYITATLTPRIHGSVFGGGEMASLGWWGADGAFYDGTGASTITITGGVEIGTEDELLKYTSPVHDNLDSRVCDAAPFENPGDWTSYAEDGTVFHTCTGNVFGGCQGDVDISAPHWISMGRSRTSTVTIGIDGASSGPDIMGCVFGGPEQGIMTGNTLVTVYSGEIGTTVTTGSGATKNYVYGDVYGGGFGSYKSELEADADNDSTVARNTLSLSYKPSIMAGRVYGDTRVDMLGGTVKGSVYGGGSYASVGYDKSSANGNTLVNIGLPGNDNPVADASLAKGSVTIEGAVFGANNFSGTPFGNTEVNIYKTAHTTAGVPITLNETTIMEGNTYPTAIKALADATTTLDYADIDQLTDDVISQMCQPERFALREVYGGGNKAAHEPVADNGTTLVHVYYCEENTIEYLYGGGNAANTKNNHLIVDGGLIEKIFGGGNGSGEGDPANVSGTALTEIHGGLHHDIFGGSNEKGTIETIQLHIDDENTTGCELMVINGYGGGNEGTGGGGDITIGCGTQFYNFYAGSNNADVTGDINVTIQGGQFHNFFGGNNQGGVISGDVTVNYRAGKIGNLFGGSNIEGNILGQITVNVFFDDDNTCPDGKNIDYVFGGGNMATYTPDNGSTLSSPKVNIYKGIINNEVYGGGKGGMYDNGSGEVFRDAVVTSNPEVNIGLGRPLSGDQYDYHEVVIGRDPESLQDPSQPFDAVTNPKIGFQSNNGNVFGGGNAATTNGNTKVSILNNSHVFGGVYGGGNNAVVTGNTDVIIGD